MVTFAGVSHVAFTVTDLDVSLRFYTEVLDFVAVMDVGYGRILMPPRPASRSRCSDTRARTATCSPS